MQPDEADAEPYAGHGDRFRIGHFMVHAREALQMALRRIGHVNHLAELSQHELTQTLDLAIRLGFWDVAEQYRRELRRRRSPGGPRPPEGT